MHTIDQFVIAQSEYQKLVEDRDFYIQRSAQAIDLFNKQSLKLVEAQNQIELLHGKLERTTRILDETLCFCKWATTELEKINRYTQTPSGWPVMPKLEPVTTELAPAPKL